MSENHLEDLAALERATALMASIQLELEAKGYPAELARVAISRAQGTAQYKARPISPTIRGQAFLDLLQDELRKAEDWVVRTKHYLNGNTDDGFTSAEADEE